MGDQRSITIIVSAPCSLLHILLSLPDPRQEDKVLYSQVVEVGEMIAGLEPEMKVVDILSWLWIQGYICYIPILLK